MSFFGGGNSRKANYSKADDAGSSREERMNRLKFELREHIRFLADYELLSTDWLRMAESLHQIANVAFMETHLPPADDNPLTQQGKKDTGTLWDQERDELAVRILLEEGKLNLALRILHKYRTATRDAEKFRASVQATSDKFKSDVATVNERCRVFEQSVGVLLRFAFSHVEALQIMDLPEFIQHCAEVMGDAERSEAAHTPLEIDKLQETLVLQYLSGLGTRMEELDEDRVMDLVHEHNLLPLTISHLYKHYTWYKIDALDAATRFLNGCMASESFQSDRARFLGDKKTQAEFVSLRALFLGEMVAPLAQGGYGLKKKDVQQLLDEMARLERPSVGLTGVVKDVVPLRERLEKYKAADIARKERAQAATAAAVHSALAQSDEVAQAAAAVAASSSSAKK